MEACDHWENIEEDIEDYRHTGQPTPPAKSPNVMWDEQDPAIVSIGKAKRVGDEAVLPHAPK